MPEQAVILSAAMQGAKLVIWAKVNTKFDDFKKMIVIRGTGNPISETAVDGPFIGTVLDENTGLVWHVFEEYRQWKTVLHVK